MEVILLENIGNLGGLGDRVQVKAGFGRNYLIPQGKAVPATAAHIAEFEARRAELEAAAAEQLSAAEARAEQINGLDVITIEANAATWGCIAAPLRRAKQQWGFAVEVQSTLQSFTCIAQLARNGHGHGLVPLGVTRALGLSERRLFRLPGLSRPVGLAGRPTVMASPLVESFCAALRENMAEEWG